MADIVINDQQVTTVVESTDGNVVIETSGATSVISTPEETTVVVLDPVLSVVTEVAPSTITILQDVVTILTEGIQGPTGATGPQGPSGASGAQILSLEAGEDLAIGVPVRVVTNKLYIADSAVNFRVIGVVTTAALTGLMATATLMGPATLSGLTSGSPYFLGAGIITTTSPASGYVIRMGQAVSGSSLILNIEEPILLQ